ncbi:FAD-dependent oxidoreductase [Pacificimonas sp. ICDLI1SI03]
MTTSGERIVIVGAGPVGLVAARLLSDAGLEVVVLERMEALPDDLRASTFHPPTLDMLAPLGVTELLLQRGLICRDWQIRLHTTGDRVLFELSAIADDTDHPFRLQCTQAVLCEIVLAQLRQAGADVRFGHEVIAVSQDADTAFVKTRDANGEETVFEGRYVVGADGARSVVRKTMAVSFDGATYPETTILAATRFPFHEALQDLSNVNYVWKDGGTFSLLRLPDLWRCSLHLDAGESVEHALRPEVVARKLDEIAPGAGAFGVDEMRPYRIHRRIAGDYRCGRLLLAGDAAHLNSPSGGMGMNGGIHDAFELVAALREIFAGGGDDLLDRYCRRRKPVAEAEILAQSDHNRARMQERDPSRRREILAQLQDIAADPERAREHLLRSSMITGLRKAATVS